MPWSLVQFQPIEPDYANLAQIVEHRAENSGVNGASPLVGTKFFNQMGNQMKDKSTKRSEATTRNAEWAKLTPAKQLEYLDGANLGAKKQRAKIAAKLASM